MYTGGWHGGGRADNEYSMGHVDGGRGNEERRIACDFNIDNGGKLARQAREGDRKARSVGLREEGMDVVRYVEHRVGNNMH